MGNHPHRAVRLDLRCDDKQPFCRAPFLPTQPFSHTARSGSPGAASAITRCTPPITAGSASQVICRCRQATPATSSIASWLTEPHRPQAAFRGPSLQSASPTDATHQRSRLTRSHAHRLCLTYPAATLTVAVTGLSYPAARPACAGRCRCLQVSPRHPDASRRPQQPTSGGPVRRLLAAPARDLHPFTRQQGTPCCHGTRVPVAQSRCTSMDWVEGAMKPQRPS